MPKPGARADNELVILKRRKRVAQLYAEGKAQFEIGLELGISQAMVSNDLKAVREEWLETQQDSVETRVQEELAGLRHQEEELWKAWYRSCGIEVVETQSVEQELRSAVEDVEEQAAAKLKSKKGRKSITSQMIPVKQSDKKVTRQLIGNPTFLSEIRAVRELRCKLLGLLKKDEPEKAQVNVNVISGEVWDKISNIRNEPDEIEVRLKQLEALPTPTPSPAPSTNGKH